MTEAINCCGICSARQNYRPAVVWCQHCSEALCGVCQENHSLSKGTGNHSTIAIADYQKLPPDVLRITDICLEHEVRFVIFCQNHLQPGCISCNLESHKACKDEVKLKKNIQNYKSSVSLQGLEESLKESNENFNKVQAKRKNNLKSIEADSRKAIDEIEKVRRKINQHLDILQDKIKSEVKEKGEKIRKQIIGILTPLSKDKQFVDNNLQTLSNVRKYASDLQAFLCSAKIEKQFNDVETRLLDASTYYESKLDIKIEPFLERFADQITTFGTVEISTSPSSVVLTRRKEGEAQLMIAKPQTRRIEDINLTVYKTIDSIGSSCHGCCILTDGRMAFTNHFSSLIRIFNTSGTEKANIKTPDYPFDVTQVSDTTLAVSCHGKDFGLHLINTKTANVIRSPLKGHKIYGITAYSDDHLIYCNRRNGIRMNNITPGTVTDIVKEKLPDDCYVTSFSSSVLNINRETSTVKCRDITGGMKWSFTDQNVLLNPLDFATDRHGNVFIAEIFSGNIVIISADGKKHKTIKCDLEHLCALDDKINDKLLAASREYGKAQVMKLI